eukprot:915824_1
MLPQQVLILFIVVIFEPIPSEVICTTAFECANQSISILNPSINAYKGAYGSATYIDANQVSCNGAFACAEVAQISGSSVRCYGGDSCSAANIKGNSTGIVYAYGVNALAHTDISGSFTAFIINCYGRLGCAYSTVKCNGLTTINAYGAYSLFNAIIDSGDNAITLDIYLNGYHAGYATNITCREGCTCKIHCAPNGCINLFLNCYDQNCIVNGLVDDSLPPITTYHTASTCSTQPNAMNFDDDDELPMSTDIVQCVAEVTRLVPWSISMLQELPQIQLYAVVTPCVISAKSIQMGLCFVKLVPHVGMHTFIQ